MLGKNNIILYCPELIMLFAAHSIQHFLIPTKHIIMPRMTAGASGGWKGFDYGEKEHALGSS